MIPSILAPLYVIADTVALGVDAVPDAVETMADCGVRWIQVRAKDCSGREIFRLAEACLGRLDGHDVDLWLDDRADVGALLPVAGVHVGQRDLPPHSVREVLGPPVDGQGPWIGYSTHDLQQLAVADSEPAVDVVALGPIFPTVSKERPDPVVGLDTLRLARGKTKKPLVAIGGIDAERLPRVLEAGADAAVVLGAACRGDIAKNCRSLVRLAESVASSIREETPWVE